MKYSDLEEALFQDLDKYSVWTREDDLLFEHALAEFNDDHSNPTFFESIASRIPWKSIEDIKKHYDDLKYDVEMIEADLIELPKYKDDDVIDDCDSSNSKMGNNNKNENETKEEEEEKKEVKEFTMVAKAMTEGPTLNTQHRKRAVPWTEQEHKLFLTGLENFGKGDWRSISRVYVNTKTPTQVASHAQKYFRRQKGKTPLERRRPSIHDIQSVNATYVTFPARHQSCPIPPHSPPISSLLGYTLRARPPTIDPTTQPQTNNGSEMPAGCPSSVSTFLPETLAFSVDESVMDPLVNIDPSAYMFPPSTIP